METLKNYGLVKEKEEVEMAVAVEHGPTYRYIDKLIVTIDQSQQQVKQLQQQMQQQSQQLRQQLQQLHQQSQQVKQLQQQLLDNQRDRANAAARTQDTMKH